MRIPLILVPKNLGKHWLRTLLTAGSITVAVFLLCVLRALVVSLDAGVRESASDRLIVQSAVSLFVSLPEAYEGKLLAVEGVEKITKFQWFGGYFENPKNFFGQFGVDPREVLEIYDEIEIVEGSPEDFLNRRTSCLIGDQLAARFDWKVGDRVPIMGTIFQRNDGQPWEFTVAGIYHSNSSNVDNGTLFFPFEYLRESLEQGGATGPRGVGVFVLQTAPGADQIAIMDSLEAQFENGPQRVLATTESEFQAQFVSMFGNIPFFVTSIGGGVLAAILLAVLNTMLMAGREQTADIGILKALGFTDASVFGVLLGQSILICGVGGLAGMGLAKLSEPSMIATMGTFFPGYRITPEILQEALLVTILLGLAAGFAPARRAAGLNVAQAMRRGA